jgi:hypothetical protein
MMRQWMDIFEQASNRRAAFVGTCVSSFDDDGYCSVAELPWLSVSDFAVADESAREMSADEFFARTYRHPVEQKTNRNETYYLESIDGVLMLYDAADDIHYFYM